MSLLPGVRYPAVMAATLVLLAAACFGGRTSRPNPADPYRITAEELEASPHNNLYDAVRQLRPGWFRRPTRGAGETAILVYLDDHQVGNAGVLRRFTTSSVAEVRYLSPTEAQVRFGQTNFGRAAITLHSLH